MIESRPGQLKSRQSRWLIAIAIFLVALGLRAGFGLFFTHAPDSADSLQYEDEFWYWSIATSYHNGDGFVGEFGHRAERMPLYPWFLSFFTAMDNGLAVARFTQWVIGALAAVAAYFLAARICRWPVVAALIVAADPTLVGSSSLLLTETPFVTCIALLWLVAWPLLKLEGDSLTRWICSGAVAALCVHTRESSILFVAALVLLVLFVRRDRRALAGTMTVVLIVFLSLFPWAYRNSKVMGQWCWLTSRGGISLYDGVRPGATGASDLAGVKNSPEVEELSESKWNDYFRQASYQAIADDPLRIAQLAVTKLARTWSPVLHAAEYQSRLIRAVFLVWYIPLYIMSAIGLWSIHRNYATWIALLIPVICICCLHSIFVGSVRYRLGALPTLAVLAVLGVYWLVNHYFRNPRNDSVR